MQRRKKLKQCYIYPIAEFVADISDPRTNEHVRVNVILAHAHSILINLSDRVRLYYSVLYCIKFSPNFACDPGVLRGA